MCMLNHCLEWDNELSQCLTHLFRCRASCGRWLCLFCVYPFCVYIIVCVYVYLVVFVVFFLFCSISFSTLILLVGSFDLKKTVSHITYTVCWRGRKTLLTHCGRWAIIYLYTAAAHVEIATCYTTDGDTTLYSRDKHYECISEIRVVNSL